MQATNVTIASITLGLGCLVAAAAVFADEPTPTDNVVEVVAEPVETVTDVVDEMPAPDAVDTNVQPELVAQMSDSDTCTYSMYNWSVDERRSVNRRNVETTFGELPEDGVDPNDPRCSLCSESQVEIDPSTLGIEGVDPFSVCYAYADAVREALTAIVAADEFEIVELTGYRAGRTRGHVEDGMRTELSNHSYGTAIDINADENGLYRSCDVDEVTAETIDDCRLGVGGEWDPTGNPEQTITRDSIVYTQFTENVGWRWGGEIDGSTKDMMHFSMTGY